MIIKFRLIFLPFLIIGVSCISLYTFMNWLLFIKFDLFSVREIVMNFGLPVFLLIIPLLKWLKPRINLLIFKKEDRSTLYLILAAVAITVPTIIAQEYIKTATGKLTELDGINSINAFEKTKYYTVKNYYTSKENFGAYIASEVTGRRSENIHFSLYIVLPVYESIIEAKKKNPPAWLGIKYTDNFKSNLSSSEIKEKIDAFIDRSQKDFDAKDVQKFVYLDRIGSSDDLEGYKKAFAKSSKFNLDNDIVLVPIHTAFEARNGNKFAWILFSFAFGSLTWLLLISIPKINKEALTKFLNGNSDKQMNGVYEFINEFMIPTKDFFVTPILINLNIFIFLLLFVQGHGFMSVNGDGLMLWGANYGPLVANGEYWRLFSSIFLHGGIIHLVGNLFGLILIGSILEPILGKAKFIFAYFVTGIIASLSSIFLYDATISVGASGAIFGLCGFFLALLKTDALHNYFEREISTYLMGLIGTFVICNLIMGFMGKVDNAAHIGGLMSGFILGLLQRILFPIKLQFKKK